MFEGDIETFWWDSDYFRGYRSKYRHPHSPSTGSAGGCDICGHVSSSRMHEQPWRRLTFEEFQEERQWARAGIDGRPKPVFTDTSFAATQARLKAPAVSTSDRGEHRKHVVYVATPEPTDLDLFGSYIDAELGRNTHTTPKETTTMNLNVTVVPGSTCAHRASVTDQSGRRGVFAEADDVFEAIKQATEYAQLVLPQSPAKVLKQRPTYTPGKLATTAAEKGLMLTHALNNAAYLSIDYMDAQGDRTYDRRVFPLRRTTDRRGFFARTEEGGTRQFVLGRVTRMVIE